MRINFEDTALHLEKICSELDDSEQINEAMVAVFKNAAKDHEAEVDRRIKFLNYAAMQITNAENMRGHWYARAKRLEKTVAWLEQNTMDLIKTCPGIPFRGTLGTLKIQKNPASLCLDDKFEFLEYKISKIVTTIDRETIKKKLVAGGAIEGASLVYNERLKVKTE